MKYDRIMIIVGLCHRVCMLGSWGPWGPWVVALTTMWLLVWLAVVISYLSQAFLMLILSYQSQLPQPPILH